MEFKNGVFKVRGREVTTWYGKLGVMFCIAVGIGLLAYVLVLCIGVGFWLLVHLLPVVGVAILVMIPGDFVLKKMGRVGFLRHWIDADGEHYRAMIGKRSFARR